MSRPPFPPEASVNPPPSARTEPESNPFVDGAGHLSEAGAHLFADGQEECVFTELRGHVAECTECQWRIGRAALSAHAFAAVAPAVEVERKRLAMEAKRRQGLAVALACGSAAAVVSLLPLLGKVPNVVQYAFFGLRRAGVPFLKASVALVCGVPLEVGPLFVWGSVVGAILLCVFGAFVARVWRGVPGQVSPALVHAAVGNAASANRGVRS